MLRKKEGIMVNRVILILISTVLGLQLFFQITAVFSHNQSQAAASTNSALPVKIIDLGTLGGETSQASDLDEAGKVVGSSVISPGGELRAFWWQEGAISPLNAADDLVTEAHAINEAQIVAGEVISGAGGQQLISPALWNNGVYTPLSAGDGKQGSARDINDSGAVAGHTYEQPGNHILIWQNNALTETIPSDSGMAQVNGLNNQKQIVGTIHGDTGDTAFLWKDNILQELGTLGGQNSAAHDINDGGEIVGSASITEDLAIHAFLWREGIMSDLGVPGDLPGATSRALGINKSGDIVGEGQVGDDMHAILWQNGQIVDLNTLLPAGSPWELLRTAVSINDKGWITGNGLIEGREHAFLMRPFAPDYFAYLPVVFGKTLAPQYDLSRYLTGDGRLYEVKFTGDFETQARHQTQFSGNRFYHTKGNEVKAEWEELWDDPGYIYRGTDTSPGDERYYTLYESIDEYINGNPGSRWAERHMSVGELYFRRPYVVFFNKSDCSLVVGGYWDPSWLKFQAIHESYTFDTGFTLDNVVELAWMPGNEQGPTQPVDERYFYAEGYGLVGWKKSSNGWQSAISEEHAPGDREDNLREEISCLNNTSHVRQSWSPKLLDGPLPEPYASMVKP